MPAPRPFTPAITAAIDRARILGVRSGATHRFTGVWVVVVRDRVFARSWSDQPSGWFRAFLSEPHGAIQLLSGRRVRVVGRRVRGERLLDAIDQAYGRKYDTAASQKWVRGFARPTRRATTLEFRPDSTPRSARARPLPR